MTILKKELKSFGDAIHGIADFFRTGVHARIHLVATIAVCIAGWYFHISSGEWIAICFACAFVICAELFNTGIEILCDFVHPGQHQEIGRVKDLAAGAVLFAALISVIIASIIFIPKC